MPLRGGSPLRDGDPQNSPNSYRRFPTPPTYEKQFSAKALNDPLDVAPQTTPRDYVALYSNVLDALLPGCDDPDERDLRCRLFHAGAIAAANIASLTGHSAQLNYMIVELCGHFNSGRFSKDVLRSALQHCRRLMSCSASAEMLEAL